MHWGWGWVLGSQIEFEEVWEKFVETVGSQQELSEILMSIPIQVCARERHTLWLVNITRNLSVMTHHDGGKGAARLLNSTAAVVNSLPSPWRIQKYLPCPRRIQNGLLEALPLAQSSHCP